MSIKIIKGNALEQEGDVLLHQVNCMGVMGSGIAKQIKDMYPEVFDHYYEMCSSIDNKKKLIGQMQLVTTDNSKNKRLVYRVANLFGQYTYERGKRVTNYEAFARGLDTLRYNLEDNQRIIIPYGIGCGLGGGEWDIILPIINFYLKYHDVIICEL